MGIHHQVIKQTYLEQPDQTLIKTDTNDDNTGYKCAASINSAVFHSIPCSYLRRTKAKTSFYFMPERKP